MARINYKKLTSKKAIATEIQFRTIKLVQQAMDDDPYIFDMIRIYRAGSTMQNGFSDAENKKIKEMISAVDRANSNLISAGNKLFDHLEKYKKK